MAILKLESPENTLKNAMKQQSNVKQKNTITEMCPSRVPIFAFGLPGEAVHTPAPVSYATDCQQPENDQQNVDLAPPWKNF